MSPGTAISRSESLKQSYAASPQLITQYFPPTKTPQCPHPAFPDAACTQEAMRRSFVFPAQLVCRGGASVTGVVIGLDTFPLDPYQLNQNLNKSVRICLNFSASKKLLPQIGRQMELLRTLSDPLLTTAQHQRSKC